MDWVEMAFQLALMAAGYLLGAASGFFAVRLVGLGVVPNAAALYVLALPLASTLVTEGFTRLWRHTPGSFGLGGLTAFLPMLVAGAGIVVLLAGAQRLVAPFDPSLPDRAGPLTVWVGLAAFCSLAALGFWRFWPEPTARLW
ncbi:hypothetical protein SAMN06265365_11229 [Tistlia consotensis]|uniref:Uncharacterized protein n=1 Tax=Tistlia consotensis USBA 355 TaxID=560819 RepID=A0A1Y6BY56_9PROT|nr:hypothetical protein [Tistlia consotensis]SMF35956.1 hypothetical protein SAMN05428998_11229 [Tistlia consotensis USBA 355]SNR71159.1 hypothetical protein SAMN06265365_11229 [Tistlia consotensis]